MAKKIYDIIPPGIKQKKQTPLTKSSSSVKKTAALRKRPLQKRVVPPKKQAYFPLKEVLAGSGVLLVLLGIFIVLKLPKAEIFIRPKLEDVSIEQTLTANKLCTTPDTQTKCIPAHVVEEQQTSKQQFPSTGLVTNDTKATGKITVYNKASASPFTLKAGTHFLSDTGKFFITLEKIVIPGVKNNTPGSVSVNVEAENTGTDYNIKPSKFSVPKLSGTAYYFSIWGESKLGMVGGSVGNAKQVTDDDLSAANNTLTTKMLADAEKAFKKKLSPDDVIAEGATQRVVVDASADQQPNAIADSFTQSATVKVSALVFTKQDLEKFAKDILQAQLDSSETYWDKSFTTSYTVNSIDLQNNTETLNLKVLAKSYTAIDSKNLTNVFQRKSSSQINAMVQQLYGDSVSQVAVKFWPFWVKSAPSNTKRIHINLVFE